MIHPGLIMLLIIAITLIIAPYAMAWRLGRLGRAMQKNTPVATTPVRFQSWVTVKGNRALTRQSIICHMMLVGETLSFRLLWGPPRTLPLTACVRAEILTRGKRATTLRLVPRHPDDLDTLTISGIIDLPKLGEILQAANIDVQQMADDRGALDLIRN